MSLIMRHRFKGFSQAGMEGTFSVNPSLGTIGLSLTRQGAETIQIPEISLPLGSTATLFFDEQMTGVTYKLNRYEDDTEYVGTMEAYVLVAPGTYDILLTDSNGLTWEQKNVLIIGNTHISGYSIQITWGGPNIDSCIMDGIDVTFPLNIFVSETAHTFIYSYHGFTFEYSEVLTASKSIPNSGTYFSKAVTLPSGNHKVSYEGDYTIVVRGGGGGGGGGGACDDSPRGGGYGGQGGSGRVNCIENIHIMPSDTIVTVLGAGGAGGAGGTNDYSPYLAESGEDGESTTVTVGAQSVSALGGDGGYGGNATGGSYYGNGGHGGNGGAGGRGGMGRMNNNGYGGRAIDLNGNINSNPSSYSSRDGEVTWNTSYTRLGKTITKASDLIDGGIGGNGGTGAGSANNTTRPGYAGSNGSTGKANLHLQVVVA